MNHKFNIGHISAYRTEIMGIATLMIIACHASVYGAIFPKSIKNILSYGNIGVEIFFFLSGIGMVYSINKTTSNMFSWYRRRYMRILLPYLVIAIPWYTIHLVMLNDSITDYFINITTLNYWIYHKGAWFVAALIPLYLVTPILVKLFQTKTGVLWLTVLIAVSSSCSLIPANGLLYNILFVVHRLPCFFIGLYTATFISSNKQISIFYIVIIPIATAIILRTINIGIGWQWPLIFVLIPILCIIFHIYRPLLPVLKSIGIISLESYILNICLGDLLPTFKWDYNGYFRYLIIIIAGISMALIINRTIIRPIIQLTHK